MLGLWISLGVFATYISTSLILLRFPTLIHKKKKQKFNCRHISHRGGAGENLENTITAYKEAIKNGSEMIEIDVQITADGIVVVSHDNDLSRITGVEGLISETLYKDLPPMLKTLDVTFDIGQEMTSSSSDTKIPTLRQVFEEFPTVPMNIDVKRDKDELIDNTIALVREFQREELVVMGNFGSTVVNKIHKREPNVPILFSIQRIIATMVLFYTGLLPFIPLKEQFFEIPLPRIILRHPTAFANLRTILKISDWLLLSPCLFRHLQRRGIQVFVFVLNEDEDFDFCLNRMSVDGVMTDYPCRLSNFIKKNKETGNSPVASEQSPILKKD